MSNGSFSTAFAKKKRWKLDMNLWDQIGWFADLESIKTSLDLGAGMGLGVEYLREQGVDARGVDGTPEIGALSNGVVQYADLTKRDALGAKNGIAELAISIEVGEHIPEPGLQAFIDNVAKGAGKWLILSWAIPNQRGRDHCSCRSPEWVANRFGDAGLLLHEEYTAEMRERAGSGWDKKLLVFGE